MRYIQLAELAVERRVKAWPQGRLQIKGQAANTMAATKWGIAPVDLDINFGKALAMETIQAMMTHSGQLYIYAGCLLPTEMDWGSTG